MFCAECGTKNEEGARFCENCGHKMEEVETPVVEQPMTTPIAVAPKKSFSDTLKEMPMKTKIITVVAIVVIALFIAVYVGLSSMSSPKKIAEKFFNATMSYDMDAVYSFLNVEDESKFTTKEMFKQINEVDEEDEDLPKVLNYTVAEPLKSADGMSATVTITYVLEGEDNSQTADIKLVKSKDKKWLLFDNWTINTSTTDIVKGYQIKVMKDSTVTVEGVKVDKKYIDKEESDDSIDVYSMPAMFESTYEVVVDLPIGIKIEDELYVSENSAYKYSLSLDNLSDEVENTLKTAIKTNLQALYNGAKDKKSFDEIKTSFEYTGADLADIKDAYETLSNSISSDITLTKVEFTDVTLSSLRINDDGTLYISGKAAYDYSLTYTSLNETKTNDSNDTDYVYLTFDYVDDTFRLVDVSSLNSYFSKYY